MSEYYIGEIRLFAGNFAPAGWAFCNGQLVSIAENETLYALIGTTYGGDGQTTFRLPDLQGRSAVHMGPRGGVGTYVIGQTGGAETVTLTSQQLPSHTHSAVYSATAGGTSPTQARWAAQSSNAYSDAASNATLAGNAISPAGGNLPHENMPPFVAVSYIIALYGIFPSQN
ncbi:phage tail protein [Microbacterium sp. OVT16B]|uniref:phage tail protein n=1 Tax=Microbacterium sp. OVT16B TaxID=2862682 RepID=UPI001CBC0045|nr:tail fiber protein [Microbacterium sp. OVT16B]